MAISDGARITIETCLNVKKGESVLILSDDSKEAIAQHLFRAALDAGSEAILAKIPDMANDGQEPPAAIARLMKEMDVIVIATEKTMSHTMARRRATRAGARIATMPGITVQMMDEGGMTADFREIRRSIFRVARKLRKARVLRVVTDIGTDLRMDIGGRSWITDDSGMCQRSGDFTNLPAGELFISPREGTAEGTLIVDGSFIETLQEPVKVLVAGGIANKITGAHDVVKELNKGGREARNIAKFGMGMNPKAKIIGRVLEDSKVLGTVNIGFGDNSVFGGNVKSTVHVLGIIRTPTVTVDNVLIMKEGELKA